MNPLSLQQSFQATNIEAMRMAQGFNEALAREATQKKVLDERTTQDQNNVQEIPKSDPLRSEERKGRDRGQGQPGSGAGSGEAQDVTGEGTSDLADQAKDADSHLNHLNLLA